MCSGAFHLCNLFTVNINNPCRIAQRMLITEIVLTTENDIVRRVEFTVLPGTDQFIRRDAIVFRMSNALPQ